MRSVFQVPVTELNGPGHTVHIGQISVIQVRCIPDVSSIVITVSVPRMMKPCQRGN